MPPSLSLSHQRTEGSDASTRVSGRDLYSDPRLLCVNPTPTDSLAARIDE